MLSMACRNTRKLVRERCASDNVRLGRFFTKRETAALLASFFRFEERKNELTVLDPGAGTGILSAAVLEAVCRGRAALSVRLVCYENDAGYLPMLKNNLERLRRRARREWGVKVTCEVREENFLLHTVENETFDCIVMNPPRGLVSKDSPEALSAKDLLSTPTVELAYLFIASALLRLADDGQMAMLLPTAFASGVSLSRLRAALLSETRVGSMHLFTSEKGLKKSFLLSVRKTEEPGEAISVSTSTDDGSVEAISTLPPLRYGFLVREDSSLLLISDMGDLRVLEAIGRFPCRFSSFGLRMKTGLTLPSRYPELLRNAPARGVVPLIHPRSLEDGRVIFPVPKMEGQYIAPSIPSLIQPNRNMILLKRFPAKSDKRRLVCAPYMASQAPGYRYISTHNKLNYIDTSGEEMDAAFLIGLYAVLSTTLYDRYVRLVSRSGQINATEFSELPLPDAANLRAIGTRLIAVRRFEPAVCDAVFAAHLKSAAKK